MFAAIDTGTTNTRVYIIDGERIIGRAYKKIGVKDTVISGSKEPLRSGISACFFEALSDAGVSLDEVDFAIASGMIITEIGLIDIPHLIAPVGINELIENAVIVEDRNVFPVDIPIIFIPGIKNDFGDVGLSGIRNIDFMKGEETQVMGILSKLHPRLPLNILIFSSHTKLIHVDSSAKITGSLTTLSGQIYEALIMHTSIGKSINQETHDFFSDETLDLAYDCVGNAGFLRSLIMPRFMEVLLNTESQERNFFINAVIGSDDIKILDEAIKVLGINTDTDFLLIGHEIRCRIYEKLLRKKGIQGDISSVWNKQEIDEFSVLGYINISKSLIENGKIKPKGVR